MSIVITFTVQMEPNQMETLAAYNVRIHKTLRGKFGSTIISETKDEAELSRGYLSFIVRERDDAEDIAKITFYELGSGSVRKATFESSGPYTPGDVLQTQEAFFTMMSANSAARFVWAAGNEKHDEGTTQDALWSKLDQPLETCWSEPEPGELKDGQQRKKIIAALGKEGVTHLGDLVQCEVLRDKVRNPNRLKTSGVHIMNIDRRSMIRIGDMLAEHRLWFNMDTAGWRRPETRSRTWRFTNPTQDPLAYLRL